MLQKLRTGLGFRVAMAIAVFAAFCLVAPPAVMAFGHGSNTVHCLTNADVADHGMHGGAAPRAPRRPRQDAGNQRARLLRALLPERASACPGPMVEGLAIRPALSPPVETILSGRVPVASTGLRSPLLSV